MNNNLIREQRLDKNGKLNTKLVRASAPSTARNVPAPTLGSAKPKTKAYKPTLSQSAQRNHSDRRRVDETNQIIVDSLNITPDFTRNLNYRFRANAVQMYDVYAATSSANALALLHHGIRSYDEAVEFLRSKNIGGLVEDNRDVMQAVMERKVDIETFQHFLQEHHIHGIDAKTVADAVEIFSIKGYRDLQSSFLYTSSEPDLADMVLQGRIDIADLKKFGAGRLKKSSDYRAIVRSLEKIKDGSASYNAAQLRHYLDHAGPELVHADAIELVDAYGIDTVSSFNHPYIAKRMHEQLKEQSDDFSEFQKVGIMNFNDMFHTIIRREQPQFFADRDDIIDMYTNGVDSVKAGYAVLEGRTVQQIIAVKKEGIAESLSDGWL